MVKRLINNGLASRIRVLLRLNLNVVRVSVRAPNRRIKAANYILRRRIARGHINDRLRRAANGGVLRFLVLNLLRNVNTNVRLINRLLSTIRNLLMFKRDRLFLGLPSHDSVEAIHRMASNNRHLRLNNAFVGEDSTNVTMGTLTDVLRRGTKASIGLGAVMNVLINVFKIRALYREYRAINRLNVGFLFNALFEYRLTFAKGIIRDLVSVRVTYDLVGG